MSSVLWTAALTLLLSACSPGLILSRLESPPATPQPAPGRYFLKSRSPDPKIREAVLAGGHPAPPDMPITLQVAIINAHQDELHRRFAAENDPKSPSFGHRLTGEELKRYARPRSDFEAVERWLTAYGIKIVSVSTEPLVHSIIAQGTAAQVEAAMNLRIDQSADGKWFANMSDPQIPNNLDGIIGGFFGLTDLNLYGWNAVAAPGR